MVSPGLAEGAHIERKAVLRFSISDDQLDRGIGHPTIDRSSYRRAGLWYTDGCGLWPTAGLARGIYQYMAARAPMEPF